MPITFNDAAQGAMFSVHLQTLALAETAKDSKAAHMAAADAMMLLLRAPKTSDNEAEHQRLRELVKRHRGML